jgi:hypothetical protein
MVMPSAMSATNVKLRVTLKRLLGVAKDSVAKVKKSAAATTASKTQNDWRDANQDSQLCCRCLIDSSSVITIAGSSFFPLSD